MDCIKPSSPPWLVLAITAPSFFGAEGAIKTCGLDPIKDNALSGTHGLASIRRLSGGRLANTCFLTLLAAVYDRHPNLILLWPSNFSISP